jgi:hypothetical protein
MMGPGALQPPYIRKADERGRITVWIVDGSYVRGHIDEEFTNFGQHYRFLYIPLDEFWIDHEAKEDETNFFIDHLRVEHRLMAKGKPYDDALAEADRQERIERRRAGDVAIMTRQGRELPDARRVHVQLWRKLENGVSVWIVDGRLVRSVFNIDFTEGGHDHIYEFVPEKEVWIDNDLEPSERGYILLHELHERNRMAGGWPYLKSHNESSHIEYHCRHNPDELHDALAKEGWS